MNRRNRRKHELNAKIRKSYIRTHSTRQYRLCRQAKLAAAAELLPDVFQQINQVLKELEQGLIRAS